MSTDCSWNCNCKALIDKSGETASWFLVLYVEVVCPRKAHKLPPTSGRQKRRSTKINFRWNHRQCRTTKRLAEIEGARIEKCFLPVSLDSSSLPLYLWAAYDRRCTAAPLYDCSTAQLSAVNGSMHTIYSIHCAKQLDEVPLIKTFSKHFN